MKRIIAMSLIAATCFMLCACGGKELTQEEREKIFYEVAEEKGLLEYLNGNQDSITVKKGGYNSITADLPEGEHFITADLPEGEHFIEILDMELVPTDNGTYRPNIKVKNIFPEDAVEYYPDQLRIYVSYLDGDGFAIHSSWTLARHLDYGQGIWTESTGSYFDEFNVTEVESIAITGYEFISLKAGYYEDFTFYPPITFSVSEMLPDEFSNSSQANSVSVEEVGIIAGNIGFIVEAKVRNTSEIKRDVITVYFQILDDNGDIVGEEELYVKDLEPGQAAKGKSSMIYDCKQNEIGCIKFASYSYGTFNGGSKSSWTIKRGDGGDFAEPYVFDKEMIAIN